jgi:hypothetical protein
VRNLSKRGGFLPLFFFADLLAVAHATPGKHLESTVYETSPETRDLSCGSFDNPKSQLGSFPLEMCDL